MARSPRDRSSHAPALVEPLEARQLMFGATFLTNHPAISALENPNDSVARFQTNWGVIDIELFDSVAPITVANFRKYIQSGAYDRSFFHRLVSTPTPFVLQGGGYKWDDATGFDSIETLPAIQNEYQRSNLEGTIAMAKIGGDPNSATSQFFFNLSDNTNLNTNNGGFTVFGRVVQGWATVLTIAGLDNRDFDQEFTGVNFDPGTFDDVPVAAVTLPPSEGNLVMIWDAELIKPYGTNEFFTKAVYFPEGFRGSTIVERVDLMNPDRNEPVRYQVIVRYESGDRDAVIATGVLSGNQRRSIKVSDLALPNLNLVREGVGYAIEVRGTRMIAASLNHRDSGATLGESFIYAADYTDAGLRSWTFGHGEKGAGFKSFLVIQNLTDQDATVSITVYSNSGTPKVFNRTIDRYARGGLNIGILGLVPAGRYSVRVTSNHPIVAALSVYEYGTGISNGSSAAGVPAGGRTEGYLTAARIPNGGTSFVSVLFAAASPAAIIVDFTFYLQNGTKLVSPNPALLTSSTRRVDRNLASFGVNLPVGQFFTIGYKVRNDAAPVTVHYLSEHNGDTLSTPFTTASKQEMHIADGYLDPANAGTTDWDIYSVFNPYASAGVTFSYLLRYRFSDGTQILGSAGTLAPQHRIDIQTHQLGNVMLKINSGAQFRFYSVSIETIQSNSEGSFNGAGIAQVTRIQNSVAWRQTMTSAPTLDDGGTLWFMNNPQFD